MFAQTVTVFNQYEYSDGTIVWYPHVLSNVHLETDKGQILKMYGADTTDNAALYIQCTSDKVITDADGNELPFLPPKEWSAQVNDSLPESITLAEGDFFWKGAWDGGNPVSDDDYTDKLNEGFYAYMNREKDYVYKITSVNGAYSVIPHFEVSGQ